MLDLLIIFQGDADKAPAALVETLQRSDVSFAICRLPKGTARIPLSDYQKLETFERVAVLGAGPAADMARDIACERGVFINLPEGGTLLDQLAEINTAIADISNGRETSISEPKYLNEKVSSRTKSHVLEAAETPDIDRQVIDPSIVKEPLGMASPKLTIPTGPEEPDTARVSRPTWKRAGLEAVLHGVAVFGALLVTLLIIAELSPPRYFFEEIRPRALAIFLAIPVIWIALFFGWRIFGPFDRIGVSVVVGVPLILAILVGLLNINFELFEFYWPFILGAPILLLVGGVGGTLLLRSLISRMRERGFKWLAVTPLLLPPASIVFAVAVLQMERTRDSDFAKWLSKESIAEQSPPAYFLGSAISSAGNGSWHVDERSFLRPKDIQDVFLIPLNTIAPGEADELRAQATQDGALLDLEDNAVGPSAETLGEPLLVWRFFRNDCGIGDPCIVPFAIDLIWPVGTFDPRSDQKGLVFETGRVLNASLVAQIFGVDTIKVCGFDPDLSPTTFYVYRACWGRVVKIIAQDHAIDPRSLAPYDRMASEAIIRKLIKTEGFVFKTDSDEERRLTAKFTHLFREPEEEAPIDIDQEAGGS